jgi:hypothetical protein
MAQAPQLAEKLETEVKEFRAMRDGKGNPSLFGRDRGSSFVWLKINYHRKERRVATNLASLLILEFAKLSNARQAILTQQNENELVKKVRKYI